jgi:hypothetical protein
VLPPAAVSPAAGDGETGWGFGEALSFLLHIERFSARSRGRIANRIIIKRGKGFKCGCIKNKCFFHAIAERPSKWRELEAGI